MKNIKLNFFILITIVIVFGTTNLIKAASVPSLSLNPTVGSSVVQVTVIGGDPNASAVLYYPSNSVMESVYIGTTNGSGNLNTTVDSAGYGITVGTQVHVEVNKQASQALTWPNYLSSGSLPLSQTSLTLSVGQNASIAASVSASLTITNNTNSSVSSATISGNNINVSAVNLGLDQITVCATNLGCNNISVTVVSSGSSLPASIYLSQNSISLTSGQNQTISLSGSGNYSISLNSNPGIASASVSGNNLNVSALSVGSTSINICASGSNGASTCTGLQVTVTKPITQIATTTEPIVSFSQSEVTLSVGQSQTVTIYGSAPYSITNNTNQDSVTASITGGNNSNTIDLHGAATGGANITVCQFGTTVCANLYVYVPVQGTTVAQSTTPPTISSLSITSANNNGSIMSVGNNLTITFSTNQIVSTPTVTIGGSSVKVSGNGSGPYSASYTITGNETKPLKFVVDFNNTAGSGGQVSFSLTSPTISTVTGTNSISSHYVFSKLLTLGTTSKDVTELQKLLTKLGFYNASATGYFGPKTQTAVKAFQKAHSLSQVGSVGPATRAILNKS